jgi:hypothetical protein
LDWADHSANPEAFGLRICAARGQLESHFDPELCFVFRARYTARHLAEYFRANSVTPTDSTDVSRSRVIGGDLQFIQIFLSAAESQTRCHFDLHYMHTDLGKSPERQ